MTTDFGKVSGDYAKYRDALPDLLFRQLKARGTDFEGRKGLDLGAGTGIFSRALAERGAEVTGIEPSAELIEAAVAQSRQAGLERISNVQAAAEEFRLPGTYSFVTAVRAWHWFDRDRTLENIRRHLMPGGSLIVINSVFETTSAAVQLTLRILKENGIVLKPAGSNAEVRERRNGFPVNWFEEWERHGFRLRHEWEQAYTLAYTREDWCGKIRSVSWLANESKELRMKVSGELLRNLSDFDAVMIIPHKYSVAVLTLES
ncbi:class I SAM-dependent methyltransferase [Paenibacillus sp. GbtcB18]|uniref:class I SAM-dependent methyltransferase n=1 Tax=Paenibacillus sp. GbtcB18 TaxID=2824763 RepID=UPI001C309757|nr:class I SAM-dependent methyltransferase [Paenibacillus sp. GbtcB18]